MMIAEKVKTEIDVLTNPDVSPCVSIIFPTHVKYPQFKDDKQKLRELLLRTEDYLEINYSKGIALPMINKVYALANSIDFYFHARSKGLGIFVSPDVAKIVRFPFTVKEKVVIADTFETRDIILL